MMSVYAIAWLAGLIVVGLIFADMQLFMLYEYHFNGFVWNLITTPGGIAALGATDSVMVRIAGQVTLLCAATALAIHNRLLVSILALPIKPFISLLAT